MEPDFWHERWQQMQIGFHQSDTNPLLRKHWPALCLPRNSAVFVPLCGKSLDMVWLAGQGHHVIGVELSQIAVDGFFEDVGIDPDTRSEAGFTIKTAGPYQLWCGDFFSLPQSLLGGISAIYDRASLIALPPEMRRRYAEKLTELSPAAARTLLITLEYDQSRLPGPPHSVPAAEVRSLFGPQWHIEEVHRETTDEIPPKFKEGGIDTADQAVFLMTVDRTRSA